MIIITSINRSINSDVDICVYTPDMHSILENWDESVKKARFNASFSEQLIAIAIYNEDVVKINECLSIVSDAVLKKIIQNPTVRHENYTKNVSPKIYKLLFDNEVKRYKEIKK